MTALGPRSARPNTKRFVTGSWWTRSYPNGSVFIVTPVSIAIRAALIWPARDISKSLSKSFKMTHLNDS